MSRMKGSLLESRGNKEIEIWKPIPDFPGYEVSSWGAVRSYWSTHGYIKEFPQRILSQGWQRGYLTVGLGKLGKTYHFHTHRLVLIEFIGPCPPGMEACHNDGIRSNNHLINLRWDTHKNNIHDAIKHGTYHFIEMKHHSTRKLTEKDIVEIRLMATKGYSHREIGKIFSVTGSHITQVVLRKRWKNIITPAGRQALEED